MNEKKPNLWFVYILRCSDNSLYTGVTTDLQRRIKEHNSNGKIAAKYTRARQPVTLVYYEKAANRSDACKREYQIKQLTKPQKERLISRFINNSDYQFSFSTTSPVLLCWLVRSRLG